MLASQEIFDNFNEGFGCWTAQGHLLQANAAFLRLLGLRTRTPFSETPDADRLSYPFSELSSFVAEQLNASDTVQHAELYLALETSAPHWLRVDARRTLGTDGKTCCYEAYITDISRLKLKEAELSHLTFYDPLTGLPNRAFILNKIASALQGAKRFPEQYALIDVNLSGFDNINQHYGRNFGDMLLRHMGATLQACCRSTDTIGRIGCDNFVILLRDPESGPQLIKIIKRIRTKFETPFAIWDLRLDSIPARMGVIFPLNDYNNPESVLRDAGIAASKAKASRNNLACKFFSKKRMEKTRKKLSLSVILQRKRNLKGFYLVYQPIVEQTGNLHSFEALVRWSHNGKSVPPSTFIPITEQTGLIKTLGDFIFETTCRQLRQWQDKYKTDITIHVNVSPYQLLENDFPDNVSEILYRTGIDGSRIFLEMTESIFLRDFEKALHNIHLLRQRGIHFCLDDFGTGYSSLSYLKMLPIECLKIDRSFINDLEEDGTSRILLKHIIALGMDMGYNLVLEGVERQTQLALLQNDHLLMQGYYFYKPLPDCEADFLLEETCEKNNAP